MYKTVVIEYSPKADDMAQKVEEKANEMLENGYELVTMSITGTAKAILVLKNQIPKAEDRAMIETYNKKVNFIDFSSLDKIINEVQK